MATPPPPLKTTTTATAPAPAIVFGASGEQGRAVLEGLVDSPYFDPVYGFSSNPDTIDDRYLADALGVIVLQGKVNDPIKVKQALTSSRAKVIFLATTMEMPATLSDPTMASASYQAAEDEEYQTIIQFFETLRQVHKDDGLDRTVVFSTLDNVHDLVRKQQSQDGQEKEVWIEPLDDGSIVPHYSGKGKGGEEAQRILQDVDGLNLILLTMPFFYSNFLAFFCPLPNNERQTQWELSGSFGDGGHKIDMMSVSDLGPLVANLFFLADKYRGQNLRIASERVSMDEIAKQFSDLFGKDIVYNPLLPKELAAVDFPGAPAMAQMCQWLGECGQRFPDLQHDVELTTSLMQPGRYQPANFETWLLTHSDSTAFSRVGLDRDAPELTKICVFGALSPQGKSVVKGLLADARKSYTIRCTTRRDLSTAEVQELIALDPKRVSFVQADFNDTVSCEKAVDGMDGAFLVADLHENPQDATKTEHLESEEQHVMNIVDACEGRVRHLIFSTMESSEQINKDLPAKDLLEFSPKARAASYARSKNMSVTFVLVPIYTEILLDMMDVRKDQDGNKRVVMQIPGSSDDAKFTMMSVEELGPAVANIFDSYECFAGHEIGLVTDFVTAHEVKQVIEDVFTEDLTVETESVDATDWIEARDTYMRDLGQLFAGLSHSQAVASRHSMAKTFQLVPNAKSLRRWVEQNRDNPAFREKLGLR